MVLSNKRRRHRRGRLLPQERALLTLLGEQRALRLDQVPRYLALLGRLRRAGLIHLHLVGKQPGWIWLTTRGLQTLGIHASGKPPTGSTLPVLHAANTIRLLLTEHDPQACWISKPDLQRVHSPSLESPTAQWRAGSGERITTQIVFHLQGTDEQIAAHLQHQFEQATSFGNSPSTALWYYAPAEVAQRLRAARALLTETRAKTISIFSYPLVHERVLLHHTPVDRLAWEPSGTSLASISAEECSLISLTTRQAPVRRALQATPTCLTWSADGAFLALGDERGNLSLWEQATGTFFVLTTVPRERITGLASLPDGQLACCSESGRLTLFDLHHRVVLFAAQLPQAVRVLAWSADGTYLAVTGRDASVHLFTTHDGRLLSTYQPHGSAIRALAWSPDSHVLAASGPGGTIHLFEALSGTRQSTITSGMAQVHHLCWSPDGTRLACAGNGPLLQIWHMPTQRLLACYCEQADAITALCWSHESTHLASASQDGTVLLYAVPPIRQTDTEA